MSLDLSSRPRLGTLRGRGVSVTALVIALLGALAQTACPGGAELDDADSFVGTGGSASGGSATGSGGAVACDVPKILGKCGSSGCHGTPSDVTTPPGGGVNLVAPGVEARIYDIPAFYMNVTTNPESCPTPAEKLLDPSGLEKSLMWTKINGGYSCGDPMPQLLELTDAEHECYNAWLAETLASPPTN